MQKDKEPNNSEYQQQVQMYQNQQEAIRLEMQAQSPLIGDIKPIIGMLDQFIDNQGFYSKLVNMENNYSHYRKTRRDGSCFYRALTFCIFERIHIQKDIKLKQKIISKITEAKQFLIKANFSGIIFEDIQDLFLQKLKTFMIQSRQDLLMTFRNPQISNYLVLMVRFLTSGQIKNNSALYETFIQNQIPLDMFCQTQVQQMNQQADQIQMIALLNYLDVGIKIIYLDSNIHSKQAHTLILPESTKQEEIKATLLYRPGHYDILYK